MQSPIDDNPDQLEIQDLEDLTPEGEDATALPSDDTTAPELASGELELDLVKEIDALVGDVEEDAIDPDAPHTDPTDPNAPATKKPGGYKEELINRPLTVDEWIDPGAGNI